MLERCPAHSLRDVWWVAPSAPMQILTPEDQIQGHITRPRISEVGIPCPVHTPDCPTESSPDSSHAMEVHSMEGHNLNHALG